MQHIGSSVLSTAGLLPPYRQVAAAVTANISSRLFSHCPDDYQYMQHSKLPTMHFQKSLPRLPIPLLQKTCDRFLAAVHPIVSGYDYENTKKSMLQFRQGVGMELHTLLKNNDAANKNTSYISEPWFNMYLSDRTPLPLNNNPLLVMKHDPRAEYQTQLIRATNLVISSLRFWRSLQDQLLEPEVYHMNPSKSDTDQFRTWTRFAPSTIATYVAYAYKAFPLDMSQYFRLFGVSRVPQLGKDRLVKCENSKHILVMMRGNFYSVDVLDDSNHIAMPSVILGRLKAVMQMDEVRGIAETALGVLTTGDRDTWARARDHLVNGISYMNGNILEREVDGALFCLCLDSPAEPMYREDDPTPQLKHLLAGDGKNRWFDKSISLIISADGTAAVNFEHSWGDGVAVLRYFNEIYKEAINTPFVHPNTVPQIPRDNSVRAIKFQIDDVLRSSVKHATVTNDAIINNLDMQIMRFPSINKKFCKSKNISPDSIMQLSFQLAYRRGFGRYVGTYESCSTAAFRHGRTETIRPCTVATTNFCEEILRPNIKKQSANKLRDMINLCSKIHGELTKEAAMGQGFDRHLFALKNMALAHNMPIPDIYTEESYKKINNNLISTSTLSSDALLAGSFGPVVQDGLGIGYSIHNEDCGAIVTSYKNACDGKLFTENLNLALRDIYDVMIAGTH